MCCLDGNRERLACLTYDNRIKVPPLPSRSPIADAVPACAMLHAYRRWKWRRTRRNRVSSASAFVRCRFGRSLRVRSSSSLPRPHTSMPNTHVSRARLQPQAHTHDDPPQPRWPAPVLSPVHATAEIVRDGVDAAAFLMPVGSHAKPRPMPRRPSTRRRRAAGRPTGTTT